jgi:hypothetical protein
MAQTERISAEKLRSLHFLPERQLAEGRTQVSPRDQPPLQSTSTHKGMNRPKPGMNRLFFWEGALGVVRKGHCATANGLFPAQDFRNRASDFRHPADKLRPGLDPRIDSSSGNPGYAGELTVHIDACLVPSGLPSFWSRPTQGNCTGSPQTRQRIR